jgi:hypothetical protein
VELRERERHVVSAKAASMASEGLRVLALAYGSQKNALTLAGLVGMSDPPRYTQETETGGHRKESQLREEKMCRQGQAG